LYWKILVLIVHLDLKNFLIGASLSRYHVVCVCVCVCVARNYMNKLTCRKYFLYFLHVLSFCLEIMAVGDILKSM